MKKSTNSLAKRGLEDFLANRLAVAGAGVLIIMLVLCIGAPLFTACDPSYCDVSQASLPMSAEHPLGTDRLGRDLFARLLYGGRISIFIGLASAVGASALGVLLGCVSAWFGKLLDRALLYVSELFSSFPQMLLVLLCVGLMGQSVANIIWVFILTGWSGVYRIVRSRILSLKEEPFVECCVANGLSGFSIMFRQLLPNAIGPVIVHTTLATAGFILAEAGLSFLGMGAPSDLPTWGNIINAAKRIDVIVSSPVLWIAPGLAISFFVLGINFLGDGLRDVFDPA
ncbi:MAG: ABC transporter permease [Oscillospiraceae bacterium]|nr:ABC transporter permease [Oscillospiraceae bacterium]